MKKYTITDATGSIIAYAETAAEARRIMTRYTCPMQRLLSRDVPAECHKRRRVGAIVQDLIQRGATHVAAAVMESPDCRCHCCGTMLSGADAEWDDGEPYCSGCRDAH